MAKNAKDWKEEVKKLIRAVLESAPHGIYLNNLLREYRAVVQEELPYRRLGYNTLEEFITDIKDTAVLTPTNRGTLVTVVASEQTEQLERMVRTQKHMSSSKRVFIPKEKPVHGSQVPQLQQMQNNQNNMQKMPPNNRFMWEQNQPRRWGPPSGHPLYFQQQYMPQQRYHPLMSNENGYPRPYPLPYCHPGLLPHPPYDQNRGMYYNAAQYHYRAPPPPPPQQKPLPIPQPLRSQIVTLLKRHPHGLMAEKFGEYFQAAFNYSIYPEMYNCRNMLEVMSLCQDIVLLRNTGSKIVFLAKEDSHKPQPTIPVDVPMFKAESAVQSASKENVIPEPLLNQSKSAAKVPLAVPSSKVEESASPRNYQHVPAKPAVVGEGVIRESTIRVSNAPAFATNVNSRTTERKDLFESLPKEEKTSSIGPSTMPYLAQKHTSFCYIQDQPTSEKLQERLTSDDEKTSSNGHNQIPLSNASRAKKMTSYPYIQNETIADESHQYRTSDRIGKDEKPAFIGLSHAKKNVSSSYIQDEKLDEEPRQFRPPDRIGDNMKSIFRKILEKHPNGIWPAELLKYYKEHTGNRLDFRELGFYSAHELAHSIPDVFKLKESKKTKDWLLLPASRTTPCYDSGTESISHESTSAKMFGKKMEPRVKISPELRKKLMQVICSCPNGIVLSDFEVLYKRLHREDLNLDSLERCYTAEALFLALPDLVILDYINDKKIVVRPTAEGKSLVSLPTELPMPYTCPKPSSFPEDAVTAIIKIPQESYPSNGPQDYFSVNVSYVENPHHFYVRLGHTADKFETLMMQMKMLYHSPGLSRQYVIPNHLICPGRHCAALYSGDQNWCRAIILEVKADDMVEVYYLDVGNSDEVHRTKLRFLKKEFTLLPSQALKAKLYRAIPVTGITWEFAAKRRFINLCLDRLLVASLTAIENGALLLSLCDTSSEKDIHMLDTLISEGHAVLENIPKTACIPFKLKFLIARATGHQIFEVPTLQVNKPKPEIITDAKDYNGPKAKGATTHKSGGQHRRRVSGLNAHISRFSLSDPSPSSPVNSVSTNESAAECNCTIIPAVVKKQNFNIIRLDENVYVPVVELSHIFWERDLLREMVKLAGIAVSFFIVTKSKRPALFEKLASLLSEHNPDENEISLCPLSRVPEILSAISQDQVELHRGFAELVNLHKAT